MNSRSLTYMNDENLDGSLTPYHLIYVRSIATNNVSLLKMAADGELLRLNCKKINVALKHFAKRFINEYLSLLHERYRTEETYEIVDFM